MNNLFVFFLVNKERDRGIFEEIVKVKKYYFRYYCIIDGWNLNINEIKLFMVMMIIFVFLLYIWF